MSELLRSMILEKFTSMSMAPLTVYLTKAQHEAIEKNIEELNSHQGLSQLISKSGYIVSVLELAGLFAGTMGRPKKIVKNKIAECRSIGVYFTAKQASIIRERAESENLSATALIVSAVESHGGFLYTHGE